MKPAHDDPLAQLTEIRAIMERSSRFLSLSGLSGVGAGVVALAGAAVGHFHFEQRYGKGGRWLLFELSESTRLEALPFLLGLALATMTMALLVAIFFTLRRTRHQGQVLWSAPVRRLVLALSVPLAAGGAFCLKLYLIGAVELVAPGLLIFYGLSLLNGSKYTLDEIRLLGLTEIGLGMVALLLSGLGWGLIFFALGFGLGHIGYGLLMYNRYERPGPAGAAAETAAAR